MADAIQNELQFLQAYQHVWMIHSMDEIVHMASAILDPADEVMKPGNLMKVFDDLVGRVCTWTPKDIEYVQVLPSCLQGLIARYDDGRWLDPDWIELRYVFEGPDIGFYALTKCFPKEWKRDYVPHHVKRDAARLVMMYQNVLAQQP